MSVNQPPNPNVATFNNLYWISSDSSLTQSQADLRYLKWPTAQGTENLQTTNVQGVLTCNDDLVINNQTLEIDGVLGQIRYADNKVQNTSYTGGLPGTYTSTNMTIDANGKISAISNGTPSVNLLPLNNTWTGTQIWNNATLGSLQSNAFQPPSNDNSNYIPTTAWCQSAISAGGAYTTVTFELSADTLGQIAYTMPVNATSYNIIIVSFGGNAGTNTDNGLGTSYMGGSGGSGQYIRYLNNAIEPSRNYCYRFTKGSGGVSTNTIGVIWYKGSAGVQADKLIQVYNGGNGTNAVGTTPGVGGLAGSGVYKPTGTTIVPSNTLISGNNGNNGTSTSTSTPTIPLGGTISLAGYNTQGGVGVGQQTSGGGGIVSSGPTKARITLQIFSS